jgi:integrase/recombinase XerD
VYTEQFITERLYLKGVSAATLAWYRSSFKAFSGALDSKQTIIERIATLRKTNSAISINTYLRGVNAYFRWLHEERHLDLIKIPRLKEEQKVLATLTAGDAKRLILFRPEGANLTRAHTLALLLLDTGLRISEALSLGWERVDFDNLVLTVAGKGGKHRVIPFSLECRRVLYRWKQRGRSDLLFPTKSGVQTSKRNVQRDMKVLGARVGITGVRFSPHTLRHTFAVSYLRAGGNLFYLSKILGHTTVTTTQRYLQSLGIDDLKAVHDRLSLLTRR